MVPNLLVAALTACSTQAVIPLPRKRRTSRVYGAARNATLSSGSSAASISFAEWPRAMTSLMPIF